MDEWMDDTQINDRQMDRQRQTNRQTDTYGEKEQESGHWKVKNCAVAGL